MQAGNVFRTIFQGEERENNKKKEQQVFHPLGDETSATTHPAWTLYKPCARFTATGISSRWQITNDLCLWIPSTHLCVPLTSSRSKVEMCQAKPPFPAISAWFVLVKAQQWIACVWRRRVADKSEKTKGSWSDRDNLHNLLFYLGQNCSMTRWINEPPVRWRRSCLPLARCAWNSPQLSRI